MNLTLQTRTLPSSLLEVQIIDMRGKLPVNPKYTWESLKGPRKVDDLTTIVFHHDALSKATTAKYSDEQLMRNIATSHINSTKNIAGGDPGFPYHAFIRNGKVYVCNNTTDFTYGVAGNNGYTIHISVSGNYAGVDTLTDSDRNALYACFFYYKEQLPAYKSSKGHRDLAATSCPGYDMTRVRNDLETIGLTAAVTDTPNDQMAKVYALKTRVDDLYNKASKPNQWQEAAIKKLSKLSDMMKAEGIL